MATVSTFAHGPPSLSKVAIIGLLTLLVTFNVMSTPALGQEDFGRRDPSRHVYDRTGVLTTAEARDLEQQATTITQRTGSPVIVYLRAKDTTARQTDRDARALMETWDVQSSDGARDGMVIFFNLEPGDLQHGSVTLLAGETLDTRNTLPRHEVTAIYEDGMRPLLVDGDIAAAIETGLDGVLHSLTVGPRPEPGPGALQRTAAAIARYGINGAALFAALVAVVFLRPRWPGRPRRDGGAIAPTLDPPNDLSPAVAGALVQGNVTSAQAEAVILDMASKGMISFEPDPYGNDPNADIHLRDASRDRSRYEEEVWQQLTRLAQGDTIVRFKDVGNLHSRLNDFRSMLKDDLVSRDWFNAHALRQRIPFLIFGFVCMGMLGLGFLITFAGREPLGAIGLVAFFAMGFSSWALAALYPQLTPAGQQAARPWRAYRDALREAKEDRTRHVDLAVALPYATAMGATDSIAERMEAASAEGYLIPGFDLEREWNRRHNRRRGGAFPYWHAFHTTITPSSSSSGHSGGSSSGGGASGGASSAGGSF